MEVIDGRALRGIRRRETILAAADEYFRSNGYAGTSLREFSTSIGMSHSGVLRHYSSKSQLLLAVLEGSPDEPLPESSAESPAAQLIQAATLRRGNPHRLGLYFALLGEASIAGHPAHEVLAAQIGVRTAWIDERLPGDGALLNAAWDGLEIIARYAGDEFDPITVMREILPLRAAAASAPSVMGRMLDEAVHVEPSHPVEPAQSLRDQILAGAASAFAEEGYRAVSIRSIAARLGIAHGTILYHFRTKEDLLEEVLINRNGHSDLAAPPDGGSSDTLADLWSRIVVNESSTGLIRVYSSLLCEGISPSHPAHAFFRDRYVRVLARVENAHARLMEQSGVRSAVSSRAIAIWFVACWDGLQIHRDFAPAIDLPEVLFAELRRIL